MKTKILNVILKMLYPIPVMIYISAVGFFIGLDNFIGFFMFFIGLFLSIQFVLCDLNANHTKT